MLVSREEEREREKGEWSYYSGLQSLDELPRPSRAVSGASVA